MITLYILLSIVGYYSCFKDLSNQVSILSAGLSPRRLDVTEKSDFQSEMNKQKNQLTLYFMGQNLALCSW